MVVNFSAAASAPQQIDDPAPGVTNPGATVAGLLVLGMFGTASNTALLLAALRPLPGPTIPAPLASALANLAAAGLIESTVNASLSAFYVSGGYLKLFPSYPAILLALLLVTSIATAWGVAGVAASRGLQPQVTKLWVRLGATFLVWPTSGGLGGATGYYVAKGMPYSISATPVVPRQKLVQISSALHICQIIFGFVLPWCLTQVAAMGGIRQGVRAFVRARQMRAQRLQESLAGHNLKMVRPGASVDTVAVLILGGLYLLLRFPFDLSCLIPGARPATLHAALTWDRFIFSAITPAATLLPGGRLASLVAVMFRCCPGGGHRPHTGKISPSLPPPPHPAKQLLAQVALVQPRVSNAVPLRTPVLFPTPYGLFLRLHHPSRTVPEYSNGVPGFLYRPMDAREIPTLTDFHSPVAGTPVSQISMRASRGSHLSHHTLQFLEPSTPRR